jgi:hypothetical protein
MKTEDLIQILSTNVEAVKGGQPRNALLMALIIGAAGAFCLMMAFLGGPSVPVRGERAAVEALTVAFTFGLTAAGVSFLMRSVRPGQPSRWPLLLIGVLFLALLAATCAVLSGTDSSSWRGMIFGTRWMTCFLCVPLFAAVPFAALMWALSKGAPTHPVWTGAIAGLVSGALGSLICVLHYTASSIPFVALWYGGTIVLCATIGAALGPRLLRW